MNMNNSDNKNKLTFVFPCIGSQYVKMGAHLLKTPIFEEEIQKCDQYWINIAGWSIKKELQKGPKESRLLNDSGVAWPCITALQVGLIKLLNHWGIKPDCVVGHSGGELTAAYCAGVLSLEQIFKIIGAHYQIIHEPELSGKLAHISLSAAELKRHLRSMNMCSDVAIAGYNGPNSTLISGNAALINQIVSDFKNKDIFSSLVNTSICFHNEVFSKYKEQISDYLGNLNHNKPQIPWYSSYFGRQYRQDEINTEFWSELCVKKLNFQNAITELIRDGYRTFIEICPHPVLKRFIIENADAKGVNIGIYHTLARDCHEKTELLSNLALLSIEKYPIREELFSKSDKQSLKKLISKLSQSQIGKEASISYSLHVENETEYVVKMIKETLGEFINIDSEKMKDLNSSFFELGVDSVLAIKVTGQLSRKLNIELPLAALFNYPTIQALANFVSEGILGDVQNPKKTITQSVPKDDPVAIIGMACRFPGGANSIEDFWQLLMEERNAVSGSPEDRSLLYQYMNENPTIKMSNFLKDYDIKTFDVDFFRITPNEAKLLDPQQRLLLEVCWEALENSGINPFDLRNKRAGIFVGICMDDFKGMHLWNNKSDVVDPYSFTGTGAFSASGRLAYFFGTKGPAISIDTACSSSLVAVHNAVSALKNGECEIALVAGVNLLLSPNMFVHLSKLNMLAADGVCKSFDKKADGYGRGEGCGVIVLKRMSKAQKDNDQLLAVIRGSAVNQSGMRNGLTVPNGDSQKELYQQALENAAVSAESIDYIEAHCPGTNLGDPIEVQSIGEVYGVNRLKETPVLIGTVKTNIGHLEAASGIAAIIKTVLAMQNERIPASLNFDEPNPYIPWDNFALKVNTKQSLWKKGLKKRRAAVNNFGLCGTNSHIILEEAEEVKQNQEFKYPFKVLNISAKSEGALRELTQKYCELLQPDMDNRIDELCYLASVGRAHFSHRLSAIGSDRLEIKQKLEQYLLKDEIDNYASVDMSQQSAVAFLFTGQGSQYPKMGLELYEIHPVFRAEMDKCDFLFESHLGKSIVEVLYSSQNLDLIDQALYAQPIIFSVEYALFKLWESFGMKPSVLIGHSIGEFAAACIAGIFSLEDAVKLVAARGRLMQSVPSNGLMISFLTNEEKARALIEDVEDVSIAAVNTLENVTISGAEASILNIIRKEKILYEKLNITHPYHSVLMVPYVQQFEEYFSEIKFSKPRIPIISIRNGQYADLTDPKYWSKHLVEPIRFYDAILEAQRQNIKIFIEIGGTATLTGLASQIVNENDSLFLPSLRKGRNGWWQLLHSLRELYLNGREIMWDRIFQMNGVNDFSFTKKLKLPTYPFQRKKYWEESISGHNYLKASTDTAQHNIYYKPKDVRMLEIQDIIAKLIERITGFSKRQFKLDQNFFELGLDSLMIFKLRKQIYDNYKIDIPAKEFLVELNTIQKIATYLDKCLLKCDTLENSSHTIVGKSKAQDEQQLQAYSYTPKTPDHELSPYVGNLVMKQLETLQGLSSLMEKQLLELKDINKINQQPKEPSSNKTNVAEQGNNNFNARKPSNDFRMLKKEYDILNSAQKNYVDCFINEYNQKTNKSKETAQKDREVLCDWIKAMNFRTTLKELVYPIVSCGSEGSRIWDIDGNEYLDLGMGFGTHYFGHKPRFIVNALEKQLHKGFELATQSDIAGETASLIRELTGMERVVFSNTGTEAVMTAIRIARTVTQRNIIVRFAGAYHGTYDGILADGDGKSSYPSALGIPQEMTANIIVLQYGAEESLDIIRQYGQDVAAVLVEPVQSRRPGYHPKQFLKDLNALTREIGAAFILDDIYMGFRICQGGSKEYFGLEPDIALYGKIIGGGLPIGVIAGKAKYLDAIDGGFWRFGDDSYPGCETTFFAGTFCRHPLSLAAAHAALSFMKEHGPALQEKVNQKAEYLENQLNQYFIEDNVPIRLKRFGSLFRFESFGVYDLTINPIEMSLFYYLLIYNGVYTWERRVFCLSTAHTFQDMDFVIRAVKAVIVQLRNGGFSFNINDSFHEASNPQKEIKPQFFPMSSVQKRIYALCNLENGDKPYHIPIAMKVKGFFDPIKSELAFRTIIQRHAELRTQLLLKHGEFVQNVLGEVDFKIDFREIKESQIQSEIDKLTVPFDFMKPPFLRVFIGKLSSEEFIFFINVHHIVVDGFSLNIIVQEFLQAYQEKELPEIKSGYEDYVKWETGYMQSETCKADQQFWKDTLTFEYSRLQLPLDYPSSVGQKFQGDVVRFKIEKNITDKIKNSAQVNGISMFMFLLADFFVLISKISGQNDMIIGTPVALRDHGEFENTVGMFTNTILLRSQIDWKLKFTEYLHQVKSDCLNIYAHSDFPFEKLVESFEENGYEGQDPLFNTMFVYENAGARVFQLENLIFEPLEINLNASQCDLAFEVIEQNDYLNINIYYDINLFKKGTVERWGQCFLNITDTILMESDIEVSKIQLLSSEEKRKFLIEFNQTKQRLPDVLTVQEIFMHQAKKTPFNTAVISGLDKITYRELDEKSDALAEILVHNGIQVNDIVPICSKLSIDLVVGYLGVLKAGAAFLPVNPELPVQRIDLILKDSNASLILSDSSSYRFLDGFKSINLKNVDLNKKSNFNWENFKSIYSHCDISYVIYTSGTTGRPKGVAIKHSSFINFVYGYNQLLDRGLSSDDHCSCIMNISFDASIFEIFPPLLFGAALVLYTGNMIDVQSLATFIASQEITVTFLPPGILSQVFSNLEKQHEYICLNKLITSLEPINDEVLLHYYKLNPDMEILNVYGPTETTIFSTSYKLSNSQPTGKVVPIGKPIANTRIYILDSQLNLVTMGGIGEIYISGAGLAKEYHNSPELTAAKFIKNPYEPGTLMYQTGDLGKWLSDGNIMFCGRNDNQIKIRGYRIELGEIEQTLLKHKDIEKAVVVVRNDENGNKYLSAFYVPKTIDISLSTTEIKAFLSSYLPDYMVPAFITAINNIPYNINGKVNQNELRESEVEPVQNQSAALEYTALQRKLITVWNEILRFNKSNTNTIGLETDFFKAGGDSIKAIQLIHKLGELNIQLHISDLYRYRSIKMISDYLECLSQSEQTDSEIASSIEGLKKEFEIEAQYEEYRIDQRSYTVLFVEDKMKAQEEKIIEYITSNFSAKTLPNYIRSSNKYRGAMKWIPLSSECFNNYKNKNIDICRFDFIPIHKWFFEQDIVDRHHFNFSAVLFSKKGFDLNVLNQVIQELLNHHDMLNSIVSSDESCLVKKAIASTNLVTVHEINGNDQNEINQVLSEIQAGFKLHEGPLFEASLLKTSEGEYLMMLIHHLLCDMISLQILVEDFKECYRQIETGKPVALPERTDSYQLWAAGIQEYARSFILKEEYEYWKKICTQKVSYICGDYTLIHGTWSDSRKLELVISEDYVKKLWSNMSQNLIEPKFVLLCALSLAIGDIIGPGKIMLNMESHGRENIFKDVNFNRTVGWFTAQYPICLELFCGNELDVYLTKIRKLLNEIPQNGIGYGILNYISDLNHDQKTQLKFNAEIFFNYLGVINSEENSELQISLMEDNVSKKNKLPWGILFVISIANGKLIISIEYDKTLYQSELIDSLAKTYQNRVMQLITFYSKHGFQNGDLGLTEAKATMTNDATKFEKLFSRKISPLEDDVYTFGSFISENDKALNDTIRKTNIICEYPASSVQIFQLEMVSSKPLRQVIACIQLNDIDSINIIKTALINIIMNHGILRTIIIKDDDTIKLQEYKGTYDLDIGSIDLSQCPPKDQEQIIDSIVMNYYMKNLETYNSLAYHMLIIKENIKDYKILYITDHVLFDFYSGEVLRRNIMMYLNKETFDFDGYTYKEYVNHINQGPQLISPEQLIEKFNLYDFQKAFNKICGSLENSKKSQLRNVSVKFKLADEFWNKNADFIWEIALVIFCNFCKKIFDTTEIPFGMLYHGRSYMNRKYFNTIGEFIDIIPFYVSDDKDPEAIINEYKEKIALIENHNINFFTLLKARQVSDKWHMIRPLISNEIIQSPSLMVFNFFGKRAKGENDLFGRYLPMLNAADTEKISYWMQFQVGYFDDTIDFSILHTLDIDDERIKNIIEDELNQILY